MNRTFDEILDDCVDRLNRGDTVQDCLRGHPEHASELEPLLRAVADTRAAYKFTPSAEARRTARQRFNARMGELETRGQAKRPLLPRILSLSPAWAAVTAAVVVALLGYFAVRPALTPGPVPEPVAEGGFSFLISDEVNAIGDFDSLEVTISSIGLHLSGEGGGWIELEPEEEVVDLKLLPGKKAQEIWAGNVTEGRYTKVFIYVSEATGVLSETGEVIDIKLPSGKLQISKPFDVRSGEETTFVYDVTVVSTGQGQAADRYNLKPQIGESGPDQEFELVGGKGQGEPGGGQGDVNGPGANHHEGNRNQPGTPVSLKPD
jgi:hypothetical protein